MAKLSYSENLEGYQQMSKPAVVSYFNYVSTLLSTWHWLFRQCWNCPMQTGLNKLEKNNFSQWSGIGKYNIFYWWNVPPGRSFICLEYLLFRCWQMYLFVFLVSGWIVELYLLFLISPMEGSFIFQSCRPATEDTDNIHETHNLLKAVKMRVTMSHF